MHQTTSLRARMAAGATAAGLALALVAGPPAVMASGWNKKPPKVKAPKSGSQYGGDHGLTLLISGKSISVVAFDFKCANTVGRTGLNDIKLTKTSKGYKFGIKAHASIAFRDDQPDENGAVNVSGRFSRNAKTVSGVFRVKSPRCSDTGDVKWSGHR